MKIKRATQFEPFKLFGGARAIHCEGDYGIPFILFKDDECGSWMGQRIEVTNLSGEKTTLVGPEKIVIVTDPLFGVILN